MKTFYRVGDAKGRVVVGGINATAAGPTAARITRHREAEHTRVRGVAAVNATQLKETF
jgi:ribosomal protein L6P/L9E